jgi:hypothetical protein
MSQVSEYLSDSNGKVWRIGADSTAPSVEVSDAFAYSDPWSVPSLPGGAWAGITYTIPGNDYVRAATLKDSAGKTWYLYPNTDGSLVLSDVALSGIRWLSPDYANTLNADGETVEAATVGLEQYEKLTASDGTVWYVVPDPGGFYILTDVEPT